jgi:hypothetical protein
MAAVSVKEAGGYGRRVETGQHSQSTEPARLTSGADRQSGSSPYSPIGKLFISVPFPVTGEDEREPPFCVSNRVG